MNYNSEEWIDIIIKNKVIEKLKLGVTYKAIAVDLKENGYPCTGDSVRKAIKRLGYKKSRNQGLYYRESQQEAIQLMDQVDIDFSIESISAKRYYDCCFGDGFFNRDNVKTRELNIDNQIIEEFEKLAEGSGVELEEYINCLLLNHLDEEIPINKTNEFAHRYILENDMYTDEERELILIKEKEGFNVYDMAVRGTDDNLMDLTEEEFNKEISKEKFIEPYV